MYTVFSVRWNATLYGTPVCWLVFFVQKKKGEILERNWSKTPYNRAIISLKCNAFYARYIVFILLIFVKKRPKGEISERIWAKTHYNTATIFKKCNVFYRRYIVFIPQRKLRKQCLGGSTWRSFHFIICDWRTKIWLSKTWAVISLFWNIQNLYCLPIALPIALPIVLPITLPNRVTYCVTYSVTYRVTYGVTYRVYYYSITDNSATQGIQQCRTIFLIDKYVYVKR